MRLHLSSKLSQPSRHLSNTPGRSALRGPLVLITLALAVLATVLASPSAASTRRTHSANVHATRFSHSAHRASAHRAGRDSRTAGRGARKHHHGAGRHSRHLHGRVLRRADIAASSTLLLGDSAVESGSDQLVAGQAEAFRLTASATGLTGAVHLYISIGNAATTLLAGIYTNAGKRPGSLLSAGSAHTTASGTWTTVPIAGVQLTAGQTYWLAILGRGGALHYRDHHQGTCPAQTSAQTSLTALPGSWASGTTYSTCPASAYITDASVLTPPLEPVAPTGSTPEPPVEPPTAGAPGEPPTTPGEPPTTSTPTEPPPSPPLDIAAPAVNGSAVENQTLSASPGTWSGSPTSYAYQWQDCNAAGEACVNVSGAKSSSYGLTAGDVGHTIRVVVTASNAGGSAVASSTQTAMVAAPPPPPPPPPPTASFTYSAISLIVGQVVTFDGSGSTCPDGPCQYEWSDDGGTTRPLPPLWPLGSGLTLSYAFANTGTKHVRLVVTDALNREATVEHNVAVEAEPTVTSPTDIAPPTISGSAREGETLSAVNGTWSGEPTSFAYQWQDCNSSGEACSDIAGATASTRTLIAGDVGHTLRVVVTATASSGATGTATSAPTATVSTKTTQTAGCFGHEEACGYPGPENTGVEKGVTLTRHVGSVVVTAPGTTVKNELIEGNLEIAASNVTVENVEVVTYSQKRACEKAGGTEGSGGLEVREHGSELVTGILIRHVTVHGVTQGCPESLGEGITMREASSAEDVRVEWSKVYWTRMCFFQSATWENNYCNDNGALPGAHYDGIYDNGEGTTGPDKPGLIVRHNTILMPHWQTAPLFLSNEQEVGEERIEDNLLAGGGYLMYLPGANAPTVKGPIVVSGNRYARCLGKEVGSKAGGHHLCEGLPEENEVTGAAPSGTSQGFFPKGGSYGVLYQSYNTSTDHLSGNYWDDDLEPAS
jgi:hypothetical protein